MSVWRTKQIERPKGRNQVVRRGAEIMGWPKQEFTGFGNGYNQTYADIQVVAGETAMQSTAVGAAVDLITSLTSELPVDVFSGVGRDRKRVPTPGYLFDPAGDGYGYEDWCAQVLISYLLRGNVFGNVLTRGGSGAFPIQIQIWHPDMVNGWIDNEGNVKWTFAGMPVTNPADFLHLRVNPVPGRILGLSMIASKAAMIGLNLTGTQFGLQWFREGAHPSGILSNSEVDMADEAVAKTAKERFLAAVRGRREPAVLGKGWSYESIQVNPEESQFLQTQQYTAAECARIFGPGMAEILGYETGGSLTYVTVEGKSIHLSVYTLNKWFRRMERLLTSMVPRGQYVKLNRRALLESTTLDRFNAHKLALDSMWETVNEVREEEDMSPVPWGDQPVNLPAKAAPVPTDGGADA